MELVQYLGKATRRLHRPIRVLAAVWIVFCARAQAEEVGAVVELEGTVREVLRLNQQIMETPEAVHSGDMIVTGRNAWAVIRLNGYGIMDLDSETSTAIPIRDDLEDPVLDLRQGRVLVFMAQATRGTLWIKAAAAVLGIRGTVVEVIVLSNKWSLIRVLEGEITIKGRVSTVKEGDQILIKPDGKPLPPSPISHWDSVLQLRHPGDNKPEDPPLLDTVDPRIFSRDF